MNTEAEQLRPGRPVGEVRAALLKAAKELTTPESSPTLYELACHAQVGFMAARRTVDNMRRAGVLVIVRKRKVDYRPNPVAEYCPQSQLKSKGITPVPIRALFPDWRTPIV